MSGLTIYGYAASINVRKVLWTCDELGLTYRREDWAGAFRSTNEPAFRALNPVGMVPVIDDDGVVLWESNTIVRYLAVSRGRFDLVPADPVARARVERWMDWQGSDFNNSWRVVFQALVRRNPAFQERAAIERSAQLFAEQVTIVDGELGRTGSYIAGPSFTAADIAIGLSLQRWRALPLEAAALPRPSLPHVDRYLATLSERPGFQRHGPGGGP